MKGERPTARDENEKFLSIFARERYEMMYCIVHDVFENNDGGGVANT